MSADEFLHMIWRDLRDDCSPVILARASGAVTALTSCGLLNALEAEAWLQRIARCPGHKDESGRSWCAYCGELSRLPDARTKQEGNTGGNILEQGL